VCVISGSAGYIVKVDKPEMWKKIVIPVLTVRSLPEHGLLVFGDFTRLAAYGRNDLVLAQFSALSRQAGVPGTVVLDTVVSVEDAVRQVKFVSGPEALSQAARNAVRWWRY
jgi:hypothetical protein